jgi:hypothetical protein
MLTHPLRALLVLSMVTAGAPAALGASDQEKAERKIEEGATALLQGMRLLLRTIPWYGQPKILPNGDILIPRRDGPSLPEAEDQDSQNSNGDTKDTRRL